MSRKHDDGFSLIEVTIALFILALLAAITAKMLVSSLRSASDDRSRVAASDLALRDIEILRSAFNSPTLGPRSIQLGQVVNANPLPGGTVGSPLVVNNRSFTVTRTAQFQSADATSSPCDGGASAQLAYLRVTVVVTWPDMGRTVPVTSSTLLTPPLGTYNAGSGHVKVKVLNQLNAPSGGTTVLLKNAAGAVISSQVTASDGCAFFAFLTPDAYSVTLSTAGSVDYNAWAPLPTQSFSVQANNVTPIVFNYAPAASVTFTMTSPVAGYAPPAATALTVYNSALTSAAHTSSFPSSAPARTLAIWPYTDGVLAWAGDCTDADPGFYGSYRVSPPWATTSGQMTAATVTGAAVTVKVTSALGVVKPGLTVVAVHTLQTCPGTQTDPVGGTTVGEVLTLPTTTDATGTTRALLPYGTWTIKVLSSTVVGAWPIALLTPVTPAGTPVPVSVLVP